MDWDKLRVFKSVAEAGSFTQAGENLNLSQSAISRQISALENSLGIPLFHRHARGLILTEHGEILYQSTNKVFDELQHVQARLSDSNHTPQGELTITTVDFIASTWLAPRISLFKDSYPDIQITVLLDDRLYDLGRREADVAIRPLKTEQSNMIEKHIKTLDLHLCASKAYLKKHGKPENLEDLRDHVMLGFPQNIQSPFVTPNWIFNKLNIDTQNNKNVLTMNSLNARYTAIQNMAGIGALPDYISRNDPELEILFPELEMPGVDMYFVYPAERKNSKRIAVFKQFLFEQIKQNAM
jgi:DNA-binding transcriptional LysR family regulator